MKKRIIANRRHCRRYAIEQLSKRFSLEKIATLEKVAWIAFFMLALLATNRSAGAVCTQSGSVGATSTQIVSANDLSNVLGRHYLTIQNTGTTNPMNVAIGSSNHATSSDYYLAPGAAWTLTMQGLKMVPGGDVAAISASGTTYSFCDF